MSLGPWDAEFIESGSWLYVGMSSAGDVIGVLGPYSYLWLSVDSGNTFQKKTFQTLVNYTGLAMSGSGNFIYLCSGGTDGQVVSSLDRGTTWNVSTVNKDGAAQPKGNYLAISCSNLGDKCVVVDEKYVYLSTNTGVTFTNIYALPATKLFTSVNMSANGAVIAAAESDAFASANASIHISRNQGVSFTAKSRNGVLGWQSIAISSDGSILYATASLFSPTITNYLYSIKTSTSFEIQPVSTAPSIWNRRPTVVTTNSTGNVVAVSVLSDTLTSPITGNTFILSGNGGITWSTRPISTHVNQVLLQNRGFLINASAVSTGGGFIYKLVQAQENSSVNITTGTGASWVSKLNIGSSQVSKISVTSDASDVFYACYAGYIYRTVGSSTTVMDVRNLPFSGNNLYLWIAMATDSSKLFVTGIGLGIYTYDLVDTTAGWVPILGDSSETFTHISSDYTGTNLFVASDTNVSILQRNQNTGEYTRSVVFSGKFYVALASADFTKLLCFGDNGVAQVSTDGGSLWTVPIIPPSSGVQRFRNAAMSKNGLFSYFQDPTGTSPNIIYSYQRGVFYSVMSTEIPDVSVDNNVNFIATDASGENVAVATTRDIFISNNFGYTYSRVIPAGQGVQRNYLAVQYNSNIYIPGTLSLSNVYDDGQFIATASLGGDIYLSSNGGLSCFLRDTLISCWENDSIVEVPIQDLLPGDVLVTGHKRSGKQVLSHVLVGQLHMSFDSRNVYKIKTGEESLYVLGGHSLLFTQAKEAQDHRSGTVPEFIYEKVIPVEGYFHVLARDHIAASPVSRSELIQFQEKPHSPYISYYHIVAGDLPNAIWANGLLTESMGAEYASEIQKDMKISSLSNNLCAANHETNNTLWQPA
jgi:hypothetical protein